MKYLLFAFLLLMISCRPESNKNIVPARNHDHLHTHDPDLESKDIIVHKTGKVYDIEPSENFQIDGATIPFRRMSIIDTNDKLITAFQMHDTVKYDQTLYFSYHTMELVNGGDIKEIIHISNHRFAKLKHFHNGVELESLDTKYDEGPASLSTSVVELYVKVYDHATTSQRKLQYRKIEIGQNEYFIRIDAEPKFMHSENDTIYFEVKNRLVKDKNGVEFIIDELFWRSKFPPHSSSEAL